MASMFSMTQQDVRPAADQQQAREEKKKEVPQLQQMVMQKGETERFNEDAFTVELP